MIEIHEIKRTILSTIKRRKKDQNKQGVIIYYATTAVLVTKVG